MSPRLRKNALIYTAVVLAMSALQVFACNACNDADTVKSNIIEAMKSRSATRAAERQANNPTQIPTMGSSSSSFDSNFFNSPASNTRQEQNKGRPVVGQD